MPAALLSVLKVTLKPQDRSDFGTKPVPRGTEPTSQACFTQPRLASHNPAPHWSPRVGPPELLCG